MDNKEKTIIYITQYVYNRRTADMPANYLSPERAATMYLDIYLRVCREVLKANLDNALNNGEGIDFVSQSVFQKNADNIEERDLNPENATRLYLDIFMRVYEEISAVDIEKEIARLEENEARYESLGKMFK